ncbi:MAG: hypothetical protein NVSMB38_23460 [Ktedonobacteraceae bacterium]
MIPLKAILEVLEPGPRPVAKSGEQYTVEAHFNPQTLQVTYHKTGTTAANVQVKQANATAAPEQETGSIADVSMDLLFDTTEKGEDVQKTTVKIAMMIRPNLLDKDAAKKPAPPVPVVRFRWGTFIFIGSIQSMSETLDFFSERGVPLRSTVKLSMNEVSLDRGDPGALGGLGTSGGIGFSASVGFSAGASAGFSAGVSLSAGIDVGTTPLTVAQAGDTLQGLAGRAGADWKAIASVNNIDNPRLVQPGTVLNLNASASAKIGP